MRGQVGQSFFCLVFVVGLGDWGGCRKLSLRVIMCSFITVLNGYGHTHTHAVTVITIIIFDLPQPRGRARGLARQTRSRRLSECAHLSIGHFLLALCHRFMLLVARGCVMILPEAHAMGKRKATHDHSVCVCVCVQGRKTTRE